MNDEEEATAIASKLLEWTAKNNCHIACVLHENKNDKNAKGHLGSFLVQKSETTISLSKSTDNLKASDVVPEYTRNKEFPSMEMTITGFDTIELCAKEENQTITERVFTTEEMKRIVEKIDGKTAMMANQFIQDTENVKKRTASKLLSQMEDNGMFTFRKEGRSNFIDINNDF